MPNQVGTSQVIRFATFEVDLQAQELRKAGLRLKLTGQPFQVLAILRAESLTYGIGGNQRVGGSSPPRFTNSFNLRSYY
jgi:hypothetical protein